MVNFFHKKIKLENLQNFLIPHDKQSQDGKLKIIN